MSDAKQATAGADWTKLLADPELVRHLAALLKVYREAPADKRDQALLDAMRQIKGGKSVKATDAQAANAAHTQSQVPTCPAPPPQFDPDDFPSEWTQDRRRHPRMKCFVAVELKLEGAVTPIWGNLSNTSIGGCFVETASPIPTGVNAEIGLWVANGKVWVKGIILTGIVTKANPCFGVRIKFAELEPTARESLREFLKFVMSSNKGYDNQNGYLAQMKR
jgi:hypothetical protein